ncbi:MAG TPA: glycosyltransferase family 2 protein [Verrucomicrobiae bacterium]|jgi:glycosyltransferase involved in cell wall biosynthesis|nr:glycosyltransferase family 2 protein [Verrucomicrobiae bacterium]
MDELPISVCIISGAEAKRIGRALASVTGWVREIIVVLNDDVQDGTEEIALRHGARVFREPWKGHVKQKNSAAAKAAQPWLLGLDADEAVSPELRAEIQRTLSDEARANAYAAFSFPRLTTFRGRWIRHGDWYPDRSIRLWKRGAAEWAGIDPHDKLQVRGKIARLHHNLLHYNAESIDHQVTKIIAFSEDFLRHEQTRAGRRAGRAALAFRPMWRFFRGYILRLGFLDGWQGYYIAWMTAFYTATRYAKAVDAAREAKAPAA